MKPRASIDRRTFLETTAASGAMLAGAPGLAGLVRERARPAVDPPAFELEEATIADLQAGMKSGKYTSSHLVQQYVARIQAMDKQVNSVLELNPDAAEIAAQMDAERKAKGPRGPLHGIPILIKDNIATQDKMNTTAGSRALLGARPPRDSFVAARLRAAGAVILGKTNLSEWANFRSTHSTSGWSGRGGQCRNPYAMGRNPSGSSSGSGVAASASFCAAAIGSETDGSIVSPSSCCSLVGIKPTLGLVSRAGIIPIAHSQDTAGPMARTVADAAAVLTALTGVDPRDPATAASDGKGADYTTFLDPRGLQGARLGVPRKHLFGWSPKVDALMEQAIAVLKAQGAVIVDPADIPTLGQFDDSEFTVLLFEFKADLNAYLADLGPAAPAHSLQDLIAWNSAHAGDELPYFGQEIFERAQEKGPLTDAEYLEALYHDRRMSQTDGIDAVMKQYQLDALIAPTNAPPGLTDLVNGDSGGGGCSTPPAVSGYPHVTVPAGYTFGLPVGLSFFGLPWSEGKLIKYAFAYEQATRLRRPPRFLPTADLRPA